MVPGTVLIPTSPSSPSSFPSSTPSSAKLIKTELVLDALNSKNSASTSTSGATAAAAAEAQQASLSEDVSAAAAATAVVQVVRQQQQQQQQQGEGSANAAPDHRPDSPLSSEPDSSSGEKRAQPVCLFRRNEPENPFPLLNSC